MSGWAEGPGGGMLANAIAAAFARAEQRDRDNEPCPTCGGGHRVIRRERAPRRTLDGDA